MGVLNQIICTLIASFLCFILGVSFAFPSSSLDLFKSENTTLNRPMTEMEVSLFSSLSSIGALISTPLIGIFLDVIGRKYCAMTASMVNVIAWIIIATCNKVEAILAAVFISGVGGAAILVVPVFVGEICQESIRGTMTSASMIFFALGMLGAYLFGGLLQYKVMVYVILSLTVLGIAMLLFLKETPLYLMKKGLEREAQKSFAFYRNAAFDSRKVLDEMDHLRRAFHPVMDDDEDVPVSVNQTQGSVDKEYFIPSDLVLETRPSEERRLRPQSMRHVPEKVSIIRFLKKNRSTRRAIVVTMVLLTSSIFQGLVVVQVNAKSLFEKTIPDWDPTALSVLLAITTIVAGIIAAYLTDSCGRRPLMIYASAATCISSILLGTQLHLDWGPEWFTALMIYFYTTVYSFGAGTVPFVFLAEVFLPEVKSIMSMLVVEWAWFCNFVILFIFNPLKDKLGLGPVFYVFAAVALLSTVFSALCQPETKGLAVDEIQDAFLTKRQREKLERLNEANQISHL